MKNNFFFRENDSESYGMDNYFVSRKESLDCNKHRQFQDEIIHIYSLHALIGILLRKIANLFSMLLFDLFVNLDKENWY